MCSTLHLSWLQAYIKCLSVVAEAEVGVYPAASSSPAAESSCCIASVVTSSPFLLLITCNQFLFALEDLKRGTCMHIHCNTNTYSQSFFSSHNQSVELSAHRCLSAVAWHLQGSSSRLPGLLLSSCTAALIYLVSVHLIVTAQLSRHATVPCTRNCSLHAVRYCSLFSWHCGNISLWIFLYLSYFILWTVVLVVIYRDLFVLFGLPTTRLQQTAVESIWKMMMTMKLSLWCGSW